MMLGGAEEIGANCCYLNLDGTGILIDAGLHPRERTIEAFPDLDALDGRPTDALVITHAHTDHLGALPYVMKRLPHVQPIMTHATRDLTHIMLHNGAKLLRSDVTRHVPKDLLAFFHRDQIDLIRQAFEAVPYEEPRTFRGYTGNSDVTLQLHWAGHILGSAGVALENNGVRIVHTGDVQFDHQKVIQRARLPRTHADIVITEATNCAIDRENDFNGEAKKLAAFINTISNRNGSVLIPCFALGKTQEILAILYGLMRKGAIPHLPIYSGGMGLAINKVYDQYCYTEPMRVPGFEISDIPQERLHRSTLSKGDFFKSPSIVVAPSGMLSKGTMSYDLALRWMQHANYGIAFIGYQDVVTPGHQLLYSKHLEPFDFGGQKVRRMCSVERLRFSAHASLAGLVDYITDVRPKMVVIMHGEIDACDGLAYALSQRLPATRILIPRKGVAYTLTDRS